MGGNLGSMSHKAFIKIPEKGPKKGPILKGVGFGPINLENMTGHVPTFWGWFWVHARNTDSAHVKPRSKNGSKNPN